MAASPEEQMATMAANLKANTGKTLEEWSSLVRKSGKTKHGEVVSWLKADHGITHGCAPRTWQPEQKEAYVAACRNFPIREFLS